MGAAIGADRSVLVRTVRLSADEASGNCSPFDLIADLGLESLVGLLVRAKLCLAAEQIREFRLGEDETVELGPADVGLVPDAPLDVEGQRELGMRELALHHDPQAFARGPIGHGDGLAISQPRDRLNLLADPLVCRVVDEEPHVHVDDLGPFCDEETRDEGSAEQDLHRVAEGELPLCDQVLDLLEHVVGSFP